MSVDTLNPVNVENEIRKCSDRISNGVKICNEKYKTYVNALAAYEVAFAKALIAYDGPGYKAKYAAVVATEKLRTARDVADVAYKYAKTLAESREDPGGVAGERPARLAVREQVGAVGVQRGRCQVIRDAVDEAAVDASQMSAYEWDDRPHPADTVHGWRPERPSVRVGPDLAPLIYRSDLPATIAFLRDISEDDARTMLGRAS